MQEHPRHQLSPEEAAAKEQAFVDGELERGTINEFDLSEMETFVGSTFTLTDSFGDVEVALKLDKLDRLPESPTERKMVRKDPFSLLFSGCSEPVLSDAIYRVSSGEKSFLLSLRPVDVWAEENKAIYEAIVN